MTVLMISMTKGITVKSLFNWVCHKYRSFNRELGKPYYPVIHSPPCEKMPAYTIRAVTALLLMPRKKDTVLQWIIKTFGTFLTDN